MFFSRLIVPVSLNLFSIIFLISSLRIDKAPMGNPNAPLYFPVIIAAGLFVLSLIYFFEEFKKRDESLDVLRKLKSGRTPKLLFGTMLICVVYSIFFEIVGFLISTILFLFLELCLVNGMKRWKVNIPVAVIFTVVVWFGFSRLLGLSLP